MNELKFGIVGTGFIAAIVANSIEQSTKGRLTAVSSRKQKTAEAFVADRSGVVPVEGVEALLAREDVEAIYIATPTTTKEKIALDAIDANKHVLIDKPLPDSLVTRRLTEAAAAKGLVIMDATHFVHHPRTEAIKAAIPEKIGEPRSLHTAFYFPNSGYDNIRFDPTLEPMGALGDMAWYSMRAIVEYLQPGGVISTAAAITEREASTGAIIRVSGLVGFDSGEASTFDVGYTAGTVVMDLQLVGTKGVITMDDFVLDWTNSFAFQNPNIKTGYYFRSGMATPNDIIFVETPAVVAQDVLMIDHFAELTFNDNTRMRDVCATTTLKTQQYLDAAWSAISR